MPRPILNQHHLNVFRSKGRVHLNYEEKATLTITHVISFLAILSFGIWVCILLKWRLSASFSVVCY